MRRQCYAPQSFVSWMSPWHAGLKRSSTLRASFAGTADPVPQNTASNFSLSLEAALIDPELARRGRWKGMGGAGGAARLRTHSDVGMARQGGQRPHVHLARRRGPACPARRAGRAGRGRKGRALGLPTHGHRGPRRADRNKKATFHVTPAPASPRSRPAYQ